MSHLINLQAGPRTQRVGWPSRRGNEGGGWPGGGGPGCQFGARLFALSLVCYSCCSDWRQFPPQVPSNLIGLLKQQ